MVAYSCIFCDIIQKKIPSTIVLEDNHIIAIEDISPKAPIHCLILPKKHIQSVLNLTAEDAEYASQILFMARDLAEKFDVSTFNLVSNNGAAAGQSVMHLHVHFLAGKNIYEPEGLSL